MYPDATNDPLCDTPTYGAGYIVGISGPGDVVGMVVGVVVLIVVVVGRMHIPL